MTALDVRTAAREKANNTFIPLDRPTSVTDQVAVQSFIDGAVWGAAYVTPTREQMAEAIHESLPDDMNGHCYQRFERCLSHEGTCAQLADAMLDLLNRKE